MTWDSLLKCFFGAIWLSGCTTIPLEQPPEGAPRAIVKFYSGHTNYQEGNIYQVYKDDSCHERGAVAAIFNWAAGKNNKTIRVAPERRLYIRGTASYAPGFEETKSGFAKGGLTMTTMICRSMISFIPEVNNKYELTQDFRSSDCRLLVKDAASGLQPESLILHKMTTACAKD